MQTRQSGITLADKGRPTWHFLESHLIKKTDKPSNEGSPFRLKVQMWQHQFCHISPFLRIGCENLQYDAYPWNIWKSLSVTNPNTKVKFRENVSIVGALSVINWWFYAERKWKGNKNKGIVAS